MRKIIYPWKMGSESGRQLSSRLNALRVYPDRRYRYREGDLVINWGNSLLPNWIEADVKWLNHPYAVERASNKLTTLKILKEADISVPEFLTDKYDKPYAWNYIVVRHKLNGHSGDGIEVIDCHEDDYDLSTIPEAPLYTEFIRSQAEYRVHVFDGNVIDYSKKVRIDEDEDDEPTEEQMQIKSHDNGWDFARGGLIYKPSVAKLALEAVKALCLDFGAVDIIVDDEGKAYVLEINTACGMADTTENSYITAILNYEIRLE